MAVSGSFLAFVLDQVAALPRVSSRRMFGGVGLYSDGVFFGLIDDDTMYLKVDDETRPAFEEAGSGPFRPYADRPEAVMKSYYAVPTSVLEDRDELAAWARRAVEVGRVTGRTSRPRRTRR